MPTSRPPTPEREGLSLAALVSGGKDSIHAARLYEEWGGTLREIITLRPSDPDAWLFHTPNLRWVPLQAEAWGIPHRFVEVRGIGEEAELRALEEALEGVRRNGAAGIVVGAIESSFQWDRVHQMAHRAGLPVFSPLWRVDGRRVVDEEIAAGLDIRIARVASEPLPPSLLGRRITRDLLREWESIQSRGRPFHWAGEGGEYETLVLDAPFWKRRLTVDQSHVEDRGGGQSTWVVDRAHTEERTPEGPSRKSG